MIRFDSVAEMEITFTVLSDDGIIFTEFFATYVAQLIVSGFSIAFQTVGPVGFFPSKVLINEHVAAAVQGRDLAGVLDVFRGIIFYLRTRHMWEPDGLEMRTEIA